MLYIFGNFLGNWATFSFIIWSHWVWCIDHPEMGLFTFDDCIFKRFRFKLECKGRDDRDLDLQCDNIWPKLETVAIFVVFVSSFANFLSYFGKFSSFKWKILNKNLAIWQHCRQVAQNILVQLLELLKMSSEISCLNRVIGNLARVPFNPRQLYILSVGWQTHIPHLHHYGSTGRAADQDMLAPDCSHIHPRLLGWGRFKPCLKIGLLPDSVVRLKETCVLLARVRVYKNWWPQ